MFKKIEGLKMVDAAFTSETDPAPNPAAPFSETLAGTGIFLNARMVGDSDVVADTTASLWRPGLKLLAVTFSPSPEEQREAYNIIHSVCQ